MKRLLRVLFALSLTLTAGLSCRALEDEADPRAQDELRRIWRERDLARGAFVPVLAARECAHKVVHRA